MNYKESKKILEEISKAKRILLAFHEGVDPDSISSNLIFRKYLQSLGKEVEIVYNEKVPEQFIKLYNIEGILENVDFAKFDFNKFDLFITLDVNEQRRLKIPSDIVIPIKIVNIDHHATKNTFRGIKVNDSSYSSTAEMTFYLLEDFNYEIDKSVADLILLGILTDTESFNYNVSARLFSTVSKLIELGADFDRANVIVYRNNTIDKLRFWSLALKNMQVDTKYRFAYTAVDHDEYKEFGDIIQGGRSIADKFVRTVENTDFGVVMTEREIGELKISIRSRERGYGLIPLLDALGGGGHFDGGGAMIKGLKFEDAVAKVLETARKFVHDRKGKKV